MLVWCKNLCIDIALSIISWHGSKRSWGKTWENTRYRSSGAENMYCCGWFTLLQRRRKNVWISLDITTKSVIPCTDDDWGVHSQWLTQSPPRFESSCYTPVHVTHIACATTSLSFTGNLGRITASVQSRHLRLNRLFALYFLRPTGWIQMLTPPGGQCKLRFIVIQVSLRAGLTLSFGLGLGTAVFHLFSLGLMSFL